MLLLMTITFYTSTANPSKLDKSGEITAIGTAHIIQRHSTLTKNNPIIIVDYNANLLNANYAYIDTFAGYYFCTVAIDTAGRLIVSCIRDSLFTWCNYIKNCPVTVIRSESAGINYVPDNKLPIDTNRFYIRGVEFPENPIEYDETDNKQYLLITNGAATGV